MHVRSRNAENFYRFVYWKLKKAFDLSCPPPEAAGAASTMSYTSFVQLFRRTGLVPKLTSELNARSAFVYSKLPSVDCFQHIHNENLSLVDFFEACGEFVVDVCGCARVESCDPIACTVSVEQQ